MNENNMNRLLRSIFEANLETAFRSFMTKGEALRQANPGLEEIFKAAKTEIRILIVADGRINFFSDDDFGLTELIDKALLPSSMPWEEIEVVKACHRGSAIGAIQDFKFDEIPDPPYDHPLSYYDQIWLFGQISELDEDGNPSEETLSDSELRELAKFMNNGGGVFATGDHEDLGAALCGRVPRVQSMRRWFFKDSPPPRNTNLRIDSLREGRDTGFQTDDQSDDVPQEIRPIFKMKDMGSAAPHELLSRFASAITVFPDHMHEGECRVPSGNALKANICLNDGTTFKEYPPERGKGEDERLSPVEVAISTSASGFVTDVSEGPFKPVIPRCYNVIVAYNGHQAGLASDESKREGVGRVVVDSSFHHFVNINLKGEKGKAKHGFTDEDGNPTNDYLAIKQYYRNIDLWLRPPEKQASYYMNMLLAARYLSPLVEEIRAGDQITLDNLIFAGTATHQAISEKFSPLDATRCAVIAAGTISDDFKLDLEKLLDPWSVSSPQIDPTHLLLNPDILIRFLLGSAMLGIARHLPGNYSKVSSALAQGEERQKQLRDLIADGVREAGRLLSPIIVQSVAVLDDFTRKLKVSL